MRYAFNGDIQVADTLHYDVVIVGAGIAGLYTAINIDPSLSVAVLSKEGIEISNSWLAQGGIAAAISHGDQPFFHVEDTLIAGAGMCNEHAVDVLCSEGPDDIHRLVELNVPFDLNEDGDLSITREGGHRRNRIVHAGGDATGREAVKSLAAIAHHRDNITFLEHTCFVDVLLDDSGISGAVIYDGQYHLIATSNIVICTGGIGQVYSRSTNPIVATGDGIAAAIRAGASLADMEYIQFHPTGLYSPEPESRAFLISEAVRGEGGILLNEKGQRFMVGQHELAELAPRDIVARAIFREIKESECDYVYLDITAKDDEFLAHRFPTIYNECLKRGIRISEDYIPVAPVQHYLMGGINTDLNGMTNIPGLFACGEAAHTGVHGANRLASNSMLECLVFGRRAADYISAHHHVRPAPKNVSLPASPVLPMNRSLDCGQIREQIKQIMTQYGYVIRTKSGLNKALDALDTIFEDISRGYQDNRDYLELINLCMIARAIISAASLRDKSVGAHYIENDEE